MSLTVSLDRIALGDVTPAEARIILSEALAPGSPHTVQALYTALRAWVWKALNERKRDGELTEWFDIIKRTAAHVVDDHPTLSERLQVLLDLIYESISISEVLPVQELLKRRHVRDVLE